MVRLCRRNHYELKSEINIVPLLDVLLVLLLIFIATVPVFTQNLEVDLSDITESQNLRTNSNLPVVIEVSLSGEYSLIIDKDRICQLSLNKIVTEIQRLLKLNPKTVFLISGVKEVPYNEIIKILNLLHNLGVKSVGLMTYPI